jgi:hypothetical protein
VLHMFQGVPGTSVSHDGDRKEAQAITVDPFPASDMKRMKEYDCGPQARAAAQLSPQRLRAEG